MKLFETGQLSGKTTFCRNGKVDELSWAESCSQAGVLIIFDNFQKFEVNFVKL